MSLDGGGKPAIILHLGGEDHHLRESVAIAEAAGYRVLKVYTQKRQRPDPRYYLGRGKILEVKEYVGKLDPKVRGSLKVIVDGVLKPSQAYNIMRELEVEVIDRVLLILEVFSLHAGSREAKLQIELATLTHQLPLLKEWVRLSKIGELPGFLSSGGYKIDAYYNMVRRRVARIRRELEWLGERRRLLRRKRRQVGTPTVAITGYFSAGKTTLFNALTGAEKPAGEEPFTTLSPKVSSLTVDGFKILAVDTVGFIDDVPVEIVEAFHATLEEIVEADLILLVVDISEEPSEISRKVRGSLDVLERIGGIDLPLIVAANKIDLVGSREEVAARAEEVGEIVERRTGRPPRVVPVSAAKRVNVEDLKREMLRILCPDIVEVEAVVPASRVDEIKAGVGEVYRVDGTLVACKIRAPLKDLEYLRSMIARCGGEIKRVRRHTG